MIEDVDIASWDTTQRYLCSLLNEVLNGFAVDYESQLGASRERLGALFSKIKAAAPKGISGAEESALLVRVAHLCEEELGAEEFFTRTGFTLDESREIAARLGGIPVASAPERLHAQAS